MEEDAALGLMNGSHVRTGMSGVEDELIIERSARKHAELEVQAKSSEAECAAAWAEAMQEVVAVLEARLQDSERELQTLKLQSDTMRAPTPTSARNSSLQNTTSLKSLVDQLQQSQIQEARRQDTFKSIQQELAQAHEAAARYREDSQKAKEETARLRAQLDVEKSNTEQMITQTTQLEMLWKQYRSSQQILERKLQEVTRREAAERAQVDALERRLRNEPLDEKVQWLEQAVADAQAKAIEERNQAARLDEENQALHLELKRLRDEMAQMHGTPSSQPSVDHGAQAHQSNVNMQQSNHQLPHRGPSDMKSILSEFEELRNVLLKMNGESKARGSGGSCEHLLLPQDIVSRGLKALDIMLEHVSQPGNGGILNHLQQEANGNGAARMMDVWKA